MADQETLKEKLKRIAECSAGECTRAIYIASNPKSISETWYAVGNKDMEELGLQSVHYVLLETEFEEIFSALQKQYGHVVDLGYTHNTVPYCFGPKRISFTEKREIKDAIRLAFSKDTQLITYKMEEKSADKHDKKYWKELASKLQKLPEEEHNRNSRTNINHAYHNLINTVTREQALMSFYRLCLMDHGDEKIILNESIDFENETDRISAILLLNNNGGPLPS